MAILTGIELCAGVGMLGVGAHAAFEFLGHEYRTVCYVEREAPAASQLVTLMEAGALPAAPIWSDLTTFDGAAWRGRVDCVIAGFPCQDLSIAGRRAGLNGSRSGLFFTVCDIADDCGARYLLLENVSGIASATAAVVDEAEGELEERAAARVLGELADRGWNAEWITLSASDVGASHGRARWFCFAWRQLADSGHDRHGRSGTRIAKRHETCNFLASQDFDLADTQHNAGRPEHVSEHGQRGNESPGQDSKHRDCGQTVVNTERTERRSQRIAGVGGQQRHDGIGRETHGGAGIAIETLGDTGLQHQQLQQRLVRPEHPGTSIGMDNAQGFRWRERRTESAGQQGRSDATEHGSAVANTEIDNGRCEQQSPSARCGWAGSARGIAIMADAKRTRWAQTGSGSLLDTGREPKPGCDNLANASSPRQQGRELTTALHRNGGGGRGNTWIN